MDNRSDGRVRDDPGRDSDDRGTDDLENRQGEVRMAEVKPIPDGYPRVSAYLYIDGAAKAIEFYQAVFDATERGRMGGPDGKVGHAELQIGDSVVMLADEHPSMGILGPKT